MKNRNSYKTVNVYEVSYYKTIMRKLDANGKFDKLITWSLTVCANNPKQAIDKVQKAIIKSYGNGCIDKTYGEVHCEDVSKFYIYDQFEAALKFEAIA